MLGNEESDPTPDVPAPRCPRGTPLQMCQLRGAHEGLKWRWGASNGVCQAELRGRTWGREVSGSQQHFSRVLISGSQPREVFTLQVSRI